MVDKGNCDKPDLWAQMKSAKENFFTKSPFAQKYGSPPASPISPTASIEKISQIELSIQVIKQTVTPSETQHSLRKSQKVEEETPNITTPEINSEDLPVEASTSPIMAGLEASAWNPGHNQTSAPSSSPQKGVSQKARPRPCIPLTRVEAPSRGYPIHSKLEPSVHRIIVQPAPVTPAAPHIQRVQSLPHTPRNSSPLAERVEAVSPSARSPKTNQAVILTEDTRVPAKMTKSDDSDEVLIARRRKPKDVPTLRGPNSFAGPRRNRSPYNLEPVRKLAQQKAVPNSNERRVSQESTQWSSDMNKGVGLPMDDSTEEPITPPPAMNENRFANEAEDEKDELAQLRKAIVMNAHRPTSHDASPEMLGKCREGAGTDRQSKEWLEIENIRTFPQKDAADVTYFPSQGFSHTGNEDERPAEQIRTQLEDQMRDCKDLYKKSPTAFPINADNNDNVTFSPTPTSRHRDVLAKIRESRQELTPKPVDECSDASKGNVVSKVLDNSWTDPAIVDWEYCPRSAPDELVYRSRFQAWLERTIKCESTVDIFHEAFFDGTAHADGVTAMYILEMRNYDLHVSPQDKKSSLHNHETVAGYCYNVNEQNRLAEEAAEHRRRVDREVRLEARRQPLRSPSSPVANIYLRPADIKDIPELRQLINWYIRASYDSPNTHDLNEDEIREQIQETRNANLPFIVAIDRRSAGTNTEKVLGYAQAREFDKHETSRFTAELELYVKDDHAGLGIGKCLLDKLLEVCDPTYTPKSGYRFEASQEERSGYYPGGRRRLARLIFTLGYVDGQGISKHNRVKKWLQHYGKFEEQGVLRGVRVKNNFLVNVTYLVHKVGCSDSNKLDP